MTDHATLVRWLRSRAKYHAEAAEKTDTVCEEDWHCSGTVRLNEAADLIEKLVEENEQLR